METSGRAARSSREVGATSGTDRRVGGAHGVSIYIQAQARTKQEQRYGKECCKQLISSHSHWYQVAYVTAGHK